MKDLIQLLGGLSIFESGAPRDSFNHNLWMTAHLHAKSATEAIYDCSYDLEHGTCEIIKLAEIEPIINEMRSLALKMALQRCRTTHITQY